MHRESFPFKGNSVLEVGCGDGAYTVEFPALGVKRVLGIDPAAVAIEAATARSSALGLADVAQFAVGNIYSLDELIATNQFDCIVMRGVLITARRRESDRRIVLKAIENPRNIMSSMRSVRSRPR
jgi:ubiquinone/menaquinone biosynthesis C-methylase UbiE